MSNIIEYIPRPHYANDFEYCPKFQKEVVYDPSTRNFSWAHLTNAVAVVETEAEALAALEAALAPIGSYCVNAAGDIFTYKRTSKDEVIKLPKTTESSLPATMPTPAYELMGKVYNNALCQGYAPYGFSYVIDGLYTAVNVDFDSNYGWNTIKVGDAFDRATMPNGNMIIRGNDGGTWTQALAGTTYNCNIITNLTDGYVFTNADVTNKLQYQTAYNFFGNIITGPARIIPLERIVPERRWVPVLKQGKASAVVDAATAKQALDDNSCTHYVLACNDVDFSKMWAYNLDKSGVIEYTSWVGVDELPDAHDADLNTLYELSDHEDSWRVVECNDDRFEITGISIFNKPSKTTYMLNETMNWAGTCVFVNFNGSDTEFFDYSSTGTTSPFFSHSLSPAQDEALTLSGTIPIQVTAYFNHQEYIAVDTITVIATTTQRVWIGVFMHYLSNDVTDEASAFEFLKNQSVYGIVSNASGSSGFFAMNGDKTAAIRMQSTIYGTTELPDPNTVGLDEQYRVDLCTYRVVETTLVDQYVWDGFTVTANPTTLLYKINETMDWSGAVITLSFGNGAETIWLPIFKWGNAGINLCPTLTPAALERFTAEGTFPTSITIIYKGETKTQSSADVTVLGTLTQAWLPLIESYTTGYDLNPITAKEGLDTHNADLYATISKDTNDGTFYYAYTSDKSAVTTYYNILSVASLPSPAEADMNTIYDLGVEGYYRVVNDCSYDTTLVRTEPDDNTFHYSLGENHDWTGFTFGLCFAAAPAARYTIGSNGEISKWQQKCLILDPVQGKNYSTVGEFSTHCSYRSNEGFLIYTYVTDTIDKVHLTSIAGTSANTPEVQLIVEFNTAEDAANCTWKDLIDGTIPATASLRAISPAGSVDSYISFYEYTGSSTIRFNMINLTQTVRFTQTCTLLKNGSTPVALTDKVRDYVNAFYFQETVDRKTIRGFHCKEGRDDANNSIVYTFNFETWEDWGNISWDDYLNGACPVTPSSVRTPATWQNVVLSKNTDGYLVLDFDLGGEHHQVISNMQDTSVPISATPPHYYYPKWN